jgi:peptidoglycan hydrolase-like protein with peptidoglycan-binding domain
VASSDTVTALAPEGTTINRGDVIYAVDNQPRVSFYGLTPAYRDLSAAATPGDDVLELEQNLVLLGYDPDHQITVDTSFDAGTIAAVDRWQADHGYPQTGVVTLGQIVFLPGAIRVGSHQLEVGGVARVGTAVTQATELDTTITVFAGSAGSINGLPAAGTAVTAGAPVFSVGGQAVNVTPEQATAGFGLAVSTHHVEDGAAVTTSTPVVDLTASHRQVTADVSVTDRATMKVGDAVRVVFPDTSQKPGTIAAIGSVAAKTSSNANATPTVPVTVVLTQDQADPNLVSTPVEVDFTQDQAKGALAVPTGALVALKEGGFAVQVQDANGAVHLVGVQPGIYSDGLVQVTGNGIAEGTKVMVPS